MTEQEQEYLRRIHELEQQVLRLQTEIKKNSETQYGLRWMDVPEAFDDKAENAVPILEEIKEKAITSEDGKPTHILIEGDNYHALTCLNYTHKGAIDVIYIDPPYNTGSDGFIYKDKRVLDKFPDGTTVPTDHPLRHSYWLSFMHKRLQLAKNLLSKRGVIFISIDDNEQANLKLLCDQVFGEKNIVASFCVIRAEGGGMAKQIIKGHDYCYVYAKDISIFTPLGKPKDIRGKIIEREGIRYWIQEDWLRKEFGKYGNCHYEELLEYKSIEQKKAIDEGLKTGEYVLIPKSNGMHIIGKLRRIDQDSSKFYSILKHLNKDGVNELKDMLIPFDYPKPLSLIHELIQGSTLFNPHSTILDFFAGSGTTMHATMQLNEEDGGHRQCILVTNNENQICEKVTYERNRRVMQGYTNAKGEEVVGLGNSLKYYRTAFVGNHDIAHINDADKVALTQKAGCLLALGENTLEEISTASTYQIFQLRQGDKLANGFEYTAIYFSGNLMHFADFRHEIEAIQQTNPLARIAVYVFTWGDPSIFENEFDDLTGITIKPIPQPILEIYQNIHKL